MAAYTTIDNPGEYFNTVLYTGNAGTQSITGVGFQPDFFWGKSRSNTKNHALHDSVRGVTKRLISNTTGEEATVAASVTAFGSDGFSLGSDTTSNANGNTFVAWNWKAETSFTNDASSTSVGTIDSAGSFNNDAGFSIVSFTGTGSAGTIKHGLNSALSIIIVKGRDFVDNWCMFHSSLGGGKKLKLNTTGAEIASSSAWNNTSPTSSVFSVADDGETNNNGSAMIAYCFAEKQGYSKFGSYTGNGNANGTFIYTGFKPAFFLQKKSSASGSYWSLWDNKRSASGSNPIGRRLFPNVSAVESEQDSSPMADFCSNGVKLRQTDADYNGSGVTYIYMAFAENPFVTSTGVPATAR